MQCPMKDLKKVYVQKLKIPTLAIVCNTLCIIGKCDAGRCSREISVYVFFHWYFLSEELCLWKLLYHLKSNCNFFYIVRLADSWRHSWCIHARSIVRGTIASYIHLFVHSYFYMYMAIDQDCLRQIYRWFQWQQYFND